jgi:hypothetical protein
MGFPTALSASTNPRVYVARIPEGNSLPTLYGFASNDAEAAGSTTITLDLTTIDGGAASGTVELEHDQPILFPADPSANPVVVKGTGVLGSYTIIVDDGAGSPALPTNSVRVGDYITFASDTTLYRITARTASANDYTIRVFPALKSAPADNSVVTVYNLLRLNLPSGQQFITIDTTGVSVPVTGCTYSMIATAASLATPAYRQLLGIESSSPTTSVETTPVATNTLVTTLKGTVGFELEVEGIGIPGDAAYREVIQPFLLDSDRSAESLYTRYESSSGGKVYQGPGSLTEADAGETVNETDTYSVTMSISVGDDFEYWLR